MHRLTHAILLVVVVGLLAIGCSSDRNNVLTDQHAGLNTAMFTIPANAVITSATYNVYLTQFANQPVNLYRVTADWDEMTVTWNSFAGAYDGTLQGGFMSDNLGWKSADVTALVKSWLDGTYDNFGILMDQPNVFYAISNYHTHEAAVNLPPYLEVCYEVDGVAACMQMPTMADAYIREYYPDLNFGDLDYMITGWGAQEYLEKQSLVRFDFDQEPPDSSYGCSRTIGYWKTHAGFGPQANVVSQYLPIWLGDPGGTKSILVSDSAIAHDILMKDVYGENSNGITKLYAQLLAAKLNYASGADITDVINAITKADAFLADYNWTDWDSLSRKMQKNVLHWHGKLDDYNNGIIGPGHCDDDIWADES